MPIIDIQNNEGRNFLFTIAINEYQQLSKLKNAVKDVHDFENLLTQVYQFQSEDIIHLHNEDATEDNIRETFRKLINMVTEDDNIIIYFSGHGYYDDDFDQGFWVPVDAEVEKISQCISNADIISMVCRFEAHHVLLLVDSCFSGTIVENMKGSVNEKYPSRRVFASGRKKIVSDGIQGQNSPFATALLSSLKYNKEKELNTTILIQEVTNAVHQLTNSEQEPIEGRVPQSGDQGGEFIFRKKLTEGEFWEEVDQIGSLDSYQRYLDVFPEGQFHKKANSKLNRLFVKGEWEEALSENTIEVYLAFIEKNKNSVFVHEALEKIKELREQLSKQEASQKIMAEFREKVESSREKFMELVADAEFEFHRAEFKKARKLFWEAMKFYLPNNNFEPDKGVIQEKQEDCTKKILFQDYVSRGDRNYRNKLYEEAIEAYSKALEIEFDINIEKKIKNAEQLLDLTIEPISEGGYIISTTPEMIAATVGKAAQESKNSSRATININPDKKKKKVIKISIKPDTKSKGSITLNKPVKQSKPPRKKVAVAKGNRLPKKQVFVKETTRAKRIKKDKTFIYIGIIVVAYILLILFLMGLF